MRSSVARIPSLSFILFAGVSNAIILDTSCNPYETLLKEGFTRAFENAGYAAEALTTTDMDSPVSDVAYWFFGPSEDWGESQTRLSNVGNIPSTFTTDKWDKSNPKNIVAYCNLERFQPTNRPDGALYDSDYKEFQSIDDLAFIGCKTGVGQKKPAAITTNYFNGNLTSIDLCQWYLETVKEQKFGIITEIETQGVLARLDTGRALEDMETTTDVDVATLFDTRVLHEMTHSKWVGTSQTDLGVPEVYGWNGCLNIQSPVNSESLALFALAVYLLRNGYTVSEDGEISTA